MNHALLLRAAALGPAVTEPGFGLVDLGPFPAMIRQPPGAPGAPGAGRVGGELYRVSRGILEALDRLELHPHLFRRTRISLAGGVAAWAYLYAVELAAENRPLAAGADGIVRWRASH